MQDARQRPIFNRSFTSKSTNGVAAAELKRPLPSVSQSQSKSVGIATLAVKRLTSWPAALRTVVAAAARQRLDDRLEVSEMLTTCRRPVTPTNS